LKKEFHYDRVAVVGRFARLVDHLLNAFLKATSPPVRNKFISPDEIQALECMLAEWYPQGLGCQRNVQEVAGVALRRLQVDLDSRYRHDVMEALEREIDYRLWCSKNVEATQG
jgi:hypothetical protein